MFREMLEEVFNNYMNTKSDNFADNEIVKIITDKIPDFLKKNIDNDFFYNIEGFAGHGMFTGCPWIAILDKKITTSTNSGIFPIYIFRQDMKGVYLSLMIGAQEFKRKYGNKAKEEIIKEASVYREKYPEILEDFNEESLNLALDKENSIIALNQFANIGAKYYEANNLPDDEELIYDLKDIIFLYDNIKLEFDLLSEEKIKELLKWFVNHSKTNKEWMPKRKRCEEFNHKWIQPDIIEKMSDEELKKHYLEYFNNGTGDKQKLIAIPRDKIIANPKFKESLLYLLNEDIDIKQRLNDLLDIKSNRHIEGMGRALITAFLMDFKPNKYCLWNSKTEAGLKILGWDKYYHIPRDTGGDQYLKIMSLLNKLKTLDPSLNLEFINIDLFLHIIAAEKEGSDIIKEKMEPTANIINLIERILNELPSIIRKNERVKGHPFGRVFYQISNVLVDIAKEIKPKKNNHAVGYYRHTNQWSKSPYIYIDDYDNKEIFSPWDQHYVIIWFTEKFDGFYLTLNQSPDYARGLLKEKIGEFTDHDLNKYINIHKENSRNLLIKSNFVSNELLEESIKVNKDSNNTIFGRYYDKNNLPNNNKLIADFKELFNLYSILKPDRDGGDFLGNEKNFFDYLKEEGYFFDSKLVENFLLSLKVKPFLILTGNSGTGKTKLAQKFAQYLDQNNHAKFRVKKENSLDESDKYISKPLTINRYIIQNTGGWRLNIPELNFLEKFSDNFTLAVHEKPTNKYHTGQGHIDNDKIFFKENTPFYKYLKNFRFGTRTIYFIKEKYDSDINLKDMIKEDFDQRRYEIVPVGANWTENRHILGFYNVIIEDYYYKPALNLIINAKDDTNNPYFLILDEMNLSHVERYFSDFLSALESDEEIELHKASLSEVNDKIEHSLPPETIKLTDNLIVIGTVNVDETTYMFSPKVLDRANTLEFLTQPAADYMRKDPEYSNIKGDVEYLLNPLIGTEIREKKILELKSYLNGVKTDKGLDLWDVLSDRINLFQEILKEANFDFGFRTINEIIRFMCVAWKYEKEPKQWNNWERYFDAQIMQKMLPKLHGSQKELSQILNKLENECNEHKYLTAAEKLKKMNKTLKDKRYVAFTG